MMSFRRLPPSLARSLAAVATGLLVASCRPSPAPQNKPASPAPAGVAPVLPPAPPEVVGPFYVGLSSLDVEANERAGRVFEDLARRLPDELAVWVNLGIARLRLGDPAGAQEALVAAEKLAPQDGRVTLLLATLDEDQGQFEKAIARLRTLPDPDAAVLHRLAELLGRTGQPDALKEQRTVFDRLSQLQPDNPVIIFGRARLLARMEDKAALEAALAGLESRRAHWTAAESRQLDAARQAAAAGNFRAAGTALTFLQNLRQAAPDYQAALTELGLGGASIGRPIREFVRHRRPEAGVSPADEALTFTEVPAAVPQPDLHLALDLGAREGHTLVTVAGSELHIAGGATLALAGGPSRRERHAVCAADIDNDFLPDLVVAGSGGLQLWLQEEGGRFHAFAPGGEAAAVLAGPSRAVWALDYDADGDLDLLVARPGAAPRLLRNNGDRSFTALDTLDAFPEIHETGWADLDGDGDNDLALLDATGRLLVSWNDRSGVFPQPVVVSDEPAVALTFGDVRGAGEFALLVLERSGIVREWAFDQGRRSWQGRELARWSAMPDRADARFSLEVADLDNNGAPDLVVSAGDASAVWLNRGRGDFLPLAGAPALFVTSIADLNGDGFPDLAGVGPRGAVVAQGRGAKGYHWQSIQTRTLGARADSRLNSFGLGGRIEIRAGPLLAMAPVGSSRTHFGLGEQEQVGVARIVWPNGVAQVEFDLQPDREVIATQRLKGSCPWIFTQAGEGFRFVKDFIWRSPLGMRINSQDTAGVDQTEDWVLLPGDSLREKDGAYEVRITAELWETHFFDHVSLKVVDHPAAVTALVDERFVPTRQPVLEVLATAPARPFAEARDQAGRDVAPLLAATDGRHVNDFPLGRFQGIAEDHWIEFVLPAGAPADRPLLLVGDGWIYPTDSSLNVAISQGDHPAPRGLVLEVPEAENGWRAVSGDLGFPAGKNKLVAIPLPAEALRDGHRRFRLRTNLEIYWDRLGWAVAEPGAELRVQPVETLLAELRHRGFSRLEAPARREPDVPARYESLAGPGPRWRDLEGYYTRHGDVRELLGGIDDRYVIMNAGDEIVLRFAAPPPPPAGWTRSFVLVGDGWVKDGDFNTVSSRTVEPLPSHDQRHYPHTARPLEEDPVFQQHRSDWERFHTRYVTPAPFGRGLMTGAATPRE